MAETRTLSVISDERAGRARAERRAQGNWRDAARANSRFATFARDQQDDATAPSTISDGQVPDDVLLQRAKRRALSRWVYLDGRL